MQIITTITDLQQWVGDRSGSGYLAETPEGHQRMVEEIAWQVREQAHASGLRYGQDWGDFLREVDLQAILEEVS